MNQERIEGDHVRQVRNLNERARVERSAGHGEAALALYGQIVDLQHAAGAARGEAHALRHMADIQLDQGNLQVAKQHYEGALEIYRNVGDGHSLDLANAVRGYAILLGEVDENAASRARWEEARAIYLACGVEDGVEEADQHLSMSPE